MPLILLACMTLVFAALGVMLVHLGWPRLKLAIASRRWPREEGLIESVRETVRRWHSNRRARQGILYSVTYLYVIAGQTRRAEWKSSISMHNLPGACPFKQGQIVSVYYDPAVPDSARLFRGVTLPDAACFVGGCAFLLGALLPLCAYFAG